MMSGCVHSEKLQVAVYMSSDTGVSCNSTKSSFENFEVCRRQKHVKWRAISVDFRKNTSSSTVLTFGSYTSVLYVMDNILFGVHYYKIIRSRSQRLRE